MSTVRSFLFVLDTLEVGGIQRQLLEVCRALVQRGDSCTVAVFRSVDLAMRPDFAALGVAVILLEKKRRIDVRFILRMRKILANPKWSFIHALSPQASLWCTLLKPALSRAPLMGSLLNTHKFREPWLRRVERYIVADRLDAVLVNSEAGGRQYQQYIRNAPRIVCVHNGVAEPAAGNRGKLRSRLQLIPDEFGIVAIGRLVPVKGHADAIKALGTLVQLGIPAKLVIIGDGPLRKSLKAVAVVHRVSRHVVFMGEQADPESFLPAFDAFVMPSHSEGFPNALLEAMASGLPCVATKVGGIPEALTDGENGLLVPARRPDRLAEALHRLYKEPLLRERLGRRAAHDASTRFPMARMLEQTIRCYDEMITAHGSSIGYVISQFPKLSEAFILREVAEVSRALGGCTVYTLKPPTEKIRHGEAQSLESAVVNHRWIDGRVLRNNGALFAANPVRYLWVLVWFLALHLRKPMELAKAVVVWPKLGGYAMEARRRQLRHLHAHWANLPTAITWAMARLAGTSFSFTAHAHDIYRHPHALAEKLRAAAFVATCTARNKRHLDRLVEKKVRSRIHLVRHFLNDLPPRRAKAQSRDLLILSVGSLMPYKGFDLLIEAVALLGKSHPARRLLLQIIGGGAELKALTALAKRLGIADRVEFTGPLAQEEVFRRLATADIFCLASRKTESGSEDNLPNVLVEAALAGVPVISTRVGSIPELIPSEEYGLLARPNDVAELVKCLSKTIEEPGKAGDRAIALEKRAKELFSRENNARILLGLLHKVLDESRNGAAQ